MPNNLLIYVMIVLMQMKQAISSCPFIQWSYKDSYGNIDTVRYPINVCLTYSTNNGQSSSMYVCNPDLKSVNISYYHGVDCHVSPYETKPWPQNDTYHFDITFDCGGNQNAPPCNYWKVRRYGNGDCQPDEFDYSEYAASLSVCQVGNIVDSCYSREETIGYTYSETNCQGDIEDIQYGKTGCDPTSNQLIKVECYNVTYPRSYQNSVLP
eukprot:320959_1